MTMVNFTVSFIYFHCFINLHLKNMYVVDERIVIIFVSDCPSFLQNQLILLIKKGVCGSVVVKALRYRPAGHGFDS